MWNSNKFLTVLATIWLALSTNMNSQNISSADVKHRIDQVLGQLPKLLTDDSTGVTAQRFLAKSESELPNDVILQYFYGVSSVLHEPTPERQQRVIEVEGYLAPHVSTLIDLFRITSRQGGAPDQVPRILTFAAPSETIKQALLEVAHSEDARKGALRDAFNLLFKLKLDDEQIHREVMTRIGYRNELNSKGDLGGELLGMGATLWALPELEPMYRQFLSIPYKPENYPARGGKASLESDYMTAIMGLAAWGTRAAAFADLLKARLAEMDPSDDVDLVNRCKETIEIVEGRVNPKPFINFKGQKLGISEPAWTDWRKGHAASNSQRPQEAGTLTTDAMSQRRTPQKQAGQKPEGGAQPASKSWLVWLLVVVAAATGAAWLLLRKSKS